MTTITIHHVHKDVAAFSIDFDLYLIKFLPVPQLFDGNLKPQIIPNIDSWFQVKTQQRYCYRGFTDMVDAFRQGLQRTYSLGDLHRAAAEAVLATKMALLERMGEHGKNFWVELIDPAKLEGVYAAKVREQFDRLRSKLGDDTFHNYLCRLWKFALRHRPGVAPVFERLIEQLGRTPEEPRLPTTHALDADLQKAVLAKVLAGHPTVYKGVPPAIQARIEALSHG